MKNIMIKTVEENVEKILKQFQEEKFNYLEADYILDQAKEALKKYSFVNLGGENNGN